MARTELVLFDFDGTLVDTAPDLIRSTNLFLESQGFNALPEQEIRSEIGMGLRKLIVTLYPGEEKSEAEKREIEGGFLAIYEREFLKTPAFFPGALEFITEWDGQIGILSNKRIRFITPILKHLGADTLPWSSVIGGDTYPNMKPHPEPFLAAMNQAGVTPEETVIVGDGHPDVIGALAAGIRCVAVEFGYTPVQELMDLGAWQAITHYDELLPLLNSPT